MQLEAVYLEALLYVPKILLGQEMSVGTPLGIFDILQKAWIP